MKSISVAQAKNQLPFFLHLVEQGESIEITRHGKAVAYLSSENKTSKQISNFELAYNNFRKQLEAQDQMTEAEWNQAFNIPRTIAVGPRHPEDFE